MRQNGIQSDSDFFSSNHPALAICACPENTEPNQSEPRGKCSGTEQDMAQFNTTQPHRGELRNCSCFITPSYVQMPVGGRDEEAQMVIEALQEVYVEKLRPIEERSKFDQV